MTENEIAKHVVDAAYHLHARFGPGLLESAYQAMLVHDLQKRDLRVACEQPVPLIYDGLDLEVGFRAMIVEERVIVELKPVEALLRPTSRTGSSGW